jgi:hypothetical protein
MLGDDVEPRGSGAIFANNRCVSAVVLDKCENTIPTARRRARIGGHVRLFLLAYKHKSVPHVPILY